MKRWGVRLIGCGFIIWTISNLYDLILGMGHVKGFMGIDLGITHNGKDINFMAWIGVYILCYTGIQLIRFDTRGRIWALIMFWPTTVFTGVFFIMTIFSPVFSWQLGAFVNLRFFSFQWSGQISDPNNLSVGIFIFLVVYAIPLYFLMRKDVKNLFLTNGVIIEGKL